MIVTCLATHSTFTFSIFNRDISHSPQSLFPQGDSLSSNAVKETDCNCYIKECLFQENLSKEQKNISILLRLCDILICNNLNLYGAHACSAIIRKCVTRSIF